MLHALYTKARADQYLAVRHQAHLDQLAAQAERTERRCLIGMVLVMLFIALL